MGLKRFTSERFLLRFLFCVALIAWPLFYNNATALNNMVIAGLYATMAVGIGLIMGQAGQPSFGHPAFFGIGAYTVAILSTKLHWPPLVTLLAGAALAGIVAYIVGRPVLRLKLYFFALATMGLTVMFVVIVSQARSVTGGFEGVVGIPWLNFGSFKFDSFIRQYYLIWVVVILMLLISEAAVRSRVGRALRAIAVNETAASALGIDTAAWKSRVFVFGSVICGLGGGLWAFLLGSANPGDFSIPLAVSVILMLLIGGSGSLFGAVVGAIVVTFLTNSLSTYQQYRTGLLSTILLLLIMFFPLGIAGSLQRGRLRIAFPRFRRVAQPMYIPNAQNGPPEGVVSSQAGVGAFPMMMVSPVTMADGTLEMSSEKAPDQVVSEPILELEDVTVAFGGLRAVNHVSIKVERGSISAIIGPNGAGKTTLFNVISGLQKPTAGTSRFAGRDITRVRSDKIARLGMARTFQNLRIFENMTVLDNVMVGRHRHESSHFISAGLRFPSQRKEEKRSIEVCSEILGELGLAGRASSLATDLPYGQQRLTEIARALATRPDLLLLDEPAAGMNAAEKAELIKAIVQANQSGITILLVEHDMGFVMGVSAKVFVLNYGTLICEGPPGDVQCNPSVIEAYLGAGQGEQRTHRVRSAEAEERMGRAEVGGAALLQVEDVSTYYGSIGAVKGVSFQVRPGEVVAILGANGAGKTTLLRTISGAVRARTGKVLMEGDDIARLSTPEIVERGICQVLEGRHVFPTLSVEDNLVLGAGKRRKGQGYQENRDLVLELFPMLRERLRQLAGTLSGGEQQMLAIGRALMGNPRLLLLDEPSMGLAPLIVEDIFRRLALLNDRGLALLMVEQNAEVALSIADRALVLQNGAVVLEGRAEDLMNNPSLHGAYLGGGADSTHGLN